MAAAEAQPALRIRLFGTHRLTLEDVPLKLPALPKTLLMLAYLILHGRGPVMRDGAAFALWEAVGTSGPTVTMKARLPGRGRPPLPA